MVGQGEERKGKERGGVHESIVDGDDEHLAGARELRVVDVAGDVRVAAGRAWAMISRVRSFMFVYTWVSSWVGGVGGALLGWETLAPTRRGFLAVLESMQEAQKRTIGGRRTESRWNTNDQTRS